MEKKRKKQQHLEEDAAETRQQQQQQQQKQQQQQQQKRQKGDKRIRQQEAKRLRDCSKAEAEISALKQTLNPSVTNETNEPTDLGPSHAAEAKGQLQQQQQQQQQQQHQEHQQQEQQQLQRKQQQKRDIDRRVKKHRTQSLSEFSAAIAAALAEDEGRGAVSLATDPDVLRKTKEEKTQEMMRRQLLAERRLRRNMQHRQPSEDDPEVEANLKRLATKGTVSFLNVLMAARRQQAAQTAGRENRKTKPRRIYKTRRQKKNAAKPKP